MAKNINIIKLTGKNDNPASSQLLYALAGGKPEPGEAWVVFRDLSDRPVWDSFMKVNLNLPGDRLAIIAHAIMSEFERSEIGSADVYIREE